MRRRGETPPNKVREARHGSIRCVAAWTAVDQPSRDPYTVSRVAASVAARCNSSCAAGVSYRASSEFCNVIGKV